ncbi:GTPase-activating protein, partial [Spiromyces aspiralis]
MSADDDTSMSAADRQRSKRENHFADSLRRKSEAKPSVSSDTAASEPNLVAAAAISASSAAAGGGDNSAILAGHARSPSVNSFMSTFGGGSRSAGPSRAGFFASVTSFFNRNSTSTMAPDAHSDAHGSEPLTPAEDMLLAQLEAQNSVIAKDPKACMYPAELFKQQLDNARKEVEGTPEEGEIDWEFWYQLAGDFDGTVRKESRKLVQQVHRGLPACIRGPVWYLLCRTGCSPELDEEYQSYKEQKSP